MDNLKLRIKLGNCEFEAEGGENCILEQFEVFQKLCRDMTINHELDNSHDNTGEMDRSLPSPSSPQTKESLPKEVERPLRKILHQFPVSPFLACSILPLGKNKDADTVLILLLGFRIFRNQQGVSVLNLNQALKKSGVSPYRLDRMLSAHTKDQLVLKAGKGKGGGYQLTQKGTLRAQELAVNLSNLLP